MEHHQHRATFVWVGLPPTRTRSTGTHARITSRASANTPSGRANFHTGSPSGPQPDEPRGRSGHLLVFGRRSQQNIRFRQSDVHRQAQRLQQRPGPLAQFRVEAEQLLAHSEAYQKTQAHRLAVSQPAVPKTDLERVRRRVSQIQHRTPAGVALVLRYHRGLVAHARLYQAAQRDRGPFRRPGPVLPPTSRIGPLPPRGHT